MLIAGRAVAGLGASGLMNGTITVILGACVPSVRPSECRFPPETREVLLTKVRSVYWTSHGR